MISQTGGRGSTVGLLFVSDTGGLCLSPSGGLSQVTLMSEEATDESQYYTSLCSLTDLNYIFYLIPKHTTDRHTYYV